MMKFSLLGLRIAASVAGLACGLTAITFGVARKFGQEVSAVATKDYDLPDGTKITLEGVCSYDQAKVSCWDSSGASSAALTNQVQTYYSKDSQRQLSFQIGKKNRLVVFSRTGLNPDLQVHQPQGEYCDVTQMNPSGDGPRLSWAQVGASNDASTTSLVVVAQGVKQDTPAKTVFKEGNSFTFHDIDYQIGGAKPAPKEEMERSARWARNEEGLKFWNYFFVLKVSQQSMGQRFYQLLDKNGDPIKYVDRDGKPVSELTYIKEYPSDTVHAYRQEDAKLKYFRRIFRLTSNERTARAFFSNINPSEVAFVQVSGAQQSSVLFKGIPLDPK